jgi:hypothetical protein
MKMAGDTAHLNDTLAMRGNDTLTGVKLDANAQHKNSIRTRHGWRAKAKGLAVLLERLST